MTLTQEVGPRVPASHPLTRSSAPPQSVQATGKLTMAHSHRGSTAHSPASSGKISCVIHGAPVTRSLFHNRAPDSRPVPSSSRSFVSHRHRWMSSSMVLVLRAGECGLGLTWNDSAAPLVWMDTGIVRGLAATVGSVTPCTFSRCCHGVRKRETGSKSGLPLQAAVWLFLQNTSGTRRWSL